MSNDDDTIQMSIALNLTVTLCGGEGLYGRSVISSKLLESRRVLGQMIPTCAGLPATSLPFSVKMGHFRLIF